MSDELISSQERIAALTAEVEALRKFREYVVGYFTESDDDAHLSRLDRLWQEVGPGGRQAINVMNESHATCEARYTEMKAMCCEAQDKCIQNAKRAEDAEAHCEGLEKAADAYIELLESCADGYYRVTESEVAKAWNTARATKRATGG